MHFLENSNFNVLTPDGFKSFDGITKSQPTENLLKIELVDGTIIECTKEHKLYISEKLRLPVRILDVGCDIYTKSGLVKIHSIEEVAHRPVYDLINVKDTNNYYINGGVLSSNCLYLDEFAFVDNDVEFYTSTYPTVSSGKTTRIIITSTPNGLNMFYKIFNDASNGTNEYKNYAIRWNEHPERDDEWADATRSNIGDTAFSVEYECSFMGSAGTLIKGSTLEKMSPNDPIREDVVGVNTTLRVFEDAIEDHNYVTIVDTSGGTGNDYSAISVIDTTSVPYKQVFMYKSNIVSPNILAGISAEIATSYNMSVLLVEVNNTSGGIVINELWNGIEYDNILMTEKVTKHKQKGDSDLDVNYGNRATPGVMTTKKSKAVGCSQLKNLLENNILFLQCIDTMSELCTFIRVGSSYQAEKTKNDDIVMTLVIFAWFTTQPYFEDYCGINTKDKIIDALQDDLDYVIGFMSNGVD